jgi:predicted CXXCH cytochrome family protein
MRPVARAVLALLLAVPAAAVAQGGPDHERPDFLAIHGRQVRADASTCQMCHARESCLECHRGTPQVAAGFPTAASGVAMNVTVRRHPPADTHLGDFVERHGSLASGRPEYCAACHVRSDCLDCHRPDAARARGYHPAGWLVGHPAQAYTRAVTCADCHNTAQFCSDCHRQAGVVSNGRRLAGGFHDAKQAFLGGHGQAARQSLESCVSCHTENDCLACHRTFKPHGPSWDGERMRQKNPQMCLPCHGASTPGGP